MTARLFDVDHEPHLLTAGDDGLLPRRTRYGECKNAVPLGDYADKLVDPRDYREVIEHCHDQEIFPEYHQKASWCPVGDRWNQNGLNYCWAWGITAAVMDQREREGKPNTPLAPVTLGWTVNWKNNGNYLESALNGVIRRGIAPASYVPNQHSRDYRSYKSGWEEAALDYRVPDDGFWDCDNSSRQRMIQHCISLLATGTSVYVAYYWWGHALQICGARWDESQPYNLAWRLRNSHNEDDVIELVGERGVPYEAIGIRETVTVL